jgi:hypothetical protein
MSNVWFERDGRGMGISDSAKHRLGAEIGA